MLECSFRKYFPVPDKNKNWVVDLFNADIREITGLTTTQENQLIDISINFSFRRIFKVSSLSSFWLSLRQDYPEISEAAIRQLILFQQFISVKKDFILMCILKINIESDLRIQLSNIDPKIQDLVSKKQHY